jgi:hypothetical protein
MTRCACITLALAGCLDEPAQPPGGNYELRHVAVVAELHDNNFDDLALIGHAGDPRTSAFVLVYDGGSQLFADKFTRLSLATSDGANVPAWIEPLALSAFQSNDGASGGVWSLVAESAQDPAVRPTSDGRRIEVTQFPLINNAFSDQIVHTPFYDANVGGFIDVPRSTYVAARDRPTDPTRVEFAYGAQGLVFWGTSLDAQQTSINNEDVSDIVQVKPHVEAAQPWIVVTSAHVYAVSQPGPAFTTSTMPPPLDVPDGEHLVRSRMIGAQQVLLITHDADPSRIMYATYDPSGWFRDDLLISAGERLVDVGLFTENDNTTDIVTLDANGELAVYDPLDRGTVPITATRNPPRTLPHGYDLLAIGGFRGITSDATGPGDDIYVINSRDPLQPMLCFTYANALIDPCH